MITFRVARPSECTREDWLHALQAILPSAQEYTGGKPPIPHGQGRANFAITGMIRIIRSGYVSAKVSVVPIGAVSLQRWRQVPYCH